MRVSNQIVDFPVSQEAVAVHHPAGANMKISHCGTELTFDRWSGQGVNDHWRCNEWDVATTEPGSSGNFILC